MTAREQQRYRNFRDIKGLLLRMLRSGNRPAYSTLVREGLAKLAIPLDLALIPWERRRIASAQPTELPVILVIGPPRAGTTLVSQVLTRYLDVTFFTNFSALFPNAPITASRLFAWLLRDSKPSFTSYYGNTSRLADPNEGFHIWNRWLGSDRYHATESLSQRTQTEMNQFLDAWLSTFGKPLLHKSVRNTDAALLLASMVRNPYFICVRRDSRMVVQSLIFARQQVQGSKTYGWGLYSQEESSQSDSMGYVDDVCRQVVRIETQLQQAKTEICPERFLEIEYEAFCAAPRQVIQRVSLFASVEVKEQRLSNELQSFKPSNKPRLSAHEQRRMEEALGRLSSSTTYS